MNLRHEYNNPNAIKQINQNCSKYTNWTWWIENLKMVLGLALCSCVHAVYLHGVACGEILFGDALKMAVPSIVHHSLRNYSSWRWRLVCMLCGAACSFFLKVAAPLWRIIHPWVVVGCYSPKTSKTWLLFLLKKYGLLLPKDTKKCGLFLWFKNVVCYSTRTPKKWTDSLIQKSSCVQSSLLFKTCSEYPKICWIFTSKNPQNAPSKSS